MITLTFLCASNSLSVKIDGQLATGGNGTYTYQWQSSTDSLNWTNITGATNQSLTISPKASIYVRRIVTSLPCSDISLKAFIYVQGPISNNSVIGNDQNICISTTAATLVGSLPAGFNSSYNYQWQQSTDGGTTWTDILTATNKDYSPGIVSVSTKYRRTVSALMCTGPQSSISNVVDIIVYPNAKATFVVLRDTSCPDFLIDTTVIRTVPFIANKVYDWFANGTYIGSGVNFPGYTVKSSGDSVVIKLIAKSIYGCLPDSMSHTFYTKMKPTPNFTLSDVEGCGPLLVTFTNTTANTGNYTYKWNFGNGQTSTATNPGAIIFPANPNYGDTTYTITLTAFSECEPVVITNKVLVHSKVKAVFTPDNTLGCAPLPVTFINNSVGATDFTWDFGDGTLVNTTTTQTMKHTYSSSVRDTFVVKLIARSYCGIDTQRYSIIISPNLVDLRVTVSGTDKFSCNPHTVNFTNNSVGATSFRWDFGDGNFLTTTTTNETIAHTYTTPGVYNVKIIGANNCSDTTGYITITILAKPKVDFSVVPLTACIGDTVRFTNLSDTTTGLTWNFGDGNTSNLTNPNYKYNAPGVYNVTLIGVRQYASGNACLDSARKTVTIVASLPGSFTVSDSVGNCTPFTVTFKNNNLPSKSTVWDFGDGTKGSGDNVTHTYLTTGTFNATMTAIHPGGCTYTYSQKIVVNGPKGTFTYEADIKCDKTPVRFEATATGIDSLRWHFGDGTFLTTTNKIVFHTYATPGIYVPSVELLAGSTCRNLLTGPDTIKIDFIKAGFTQSALANCGNTVVSFKDTSRTFSGVLETAWKFGDGTSSMLQNPTHTYTTSNSWKVELIAKSKFGCMDTASNPVVVTLKEIPVASIINDTAACANKRITYSSSVVSTDPILSYRWSFTNGVNNNGMNVNNVYANAGNYNATLIVSTVNGCLDTATSTIKINPAPFVNATPDQSICLGQSIQLTASGGASYSWGPFTNLTCLNCPNPIANPTKTTKYTVTALNGFGCASQDTVLISVAQPFKMAKRANDTLCIGQTSQLSASGAEMYKWSPSLGLNNANIANPIATPAITTRYRVIGTDSNNCFVDTAYVTVAVGKYPTIDLGNDKILSAGTLLPLTSVVTNGPITKWQWTPSRDLTCSNCPQPVATVKRDIKYTVTATNEYGCAATDTINIKAFCENTQVFIPNVFTPDGDGANDILMVRGAGINSVKSFRIFNRWGELVFDKANFSPNEKSSGWDGTIRGVKAPTDVYVYTCEVICENGNSFVYKGNVAIIK